MKPLFTLLSALLLLSGLLPSAAAEAAASLTFTVTTSLDSVDAAPGNGVCTDSNGLCSLRAAIMEANSTIAPDLIILPAAAYALTLSGAGEDLSATGDLDIKNTLTIQGAGAAVTIIDGASLHDRVVQVLPGANLTLSGVAIRSGSNTSASTTVPDQYAGGILNQGVLSLSASNVSGNSAMFGAGIFNFGGTCTVVNSTISGNQADSEGGGIANDNLTPGDAVFTLNDSTVSNNVASGSAGAGIINIGLFTANNAVIAVNHSLGAGGGIYAANGAGVFMTLNHSQVTANRADFDGGGIAALGALTLNNSEVSGNVAARGGGILAAGAVTLNTSQVTGNQAASDGGGIYLLFSQGSSEQLSMTDSAVVANLALTGSGGGLYGSVGGATLARNIFRLNNAALDGGGMLVANGAVVYLSNSTFADNSAGRSGGGIEVSGGALHGSNLTIAGNLANTTPASLGSGGGIDNTGTVTLRNTILALNEHQTAGEPLADDCHGAFGLFSYDLVGAVGCTFTSDHTLTGADPLLLPLALNGGPTLTRALQRGSPAIDAGNPAGCSDDALAPLTTDQRGFPRPLNGSGAATARCDIGAYEYGSLAFIPLIRH